MNSEFTIVRLEEAQALYDSLPTELQWPTLSPAYVVVDAMRDPRLKPIFLVSRYGRGFLMHAVHEQRIPERNSCDWQSPYGYGGPIAYELDAEALNRAWTEIDVNAASRHVVAEFVRFHPGAANHRFYRGSICEDRPVVMINLASADLFATYTGRARTAIRKAERAGLQVVWEPSTLAIEYFPDFYRRCMYEIGADEFYLFSDQYFYGLLNLPGARVLSVMAGDRRIAMGLFLFGPEQAEYHLSGTLQDSRRSGATNLMLHAASKAAQSFGCLKLYLGGGTSVRPDDSLLRFKESFAASSLRFRIGYRIHEPLEYAAMREEYPELAQKSNRILFYRN